MIATEEKRHNSWWHQLNAVPICPKCTEARGHRVICVVYKTKRILNGETKVQYRKCPHCEFRMQTANRTN